MSQGFEYPAYLKIEHQKDASTEAEFLTAVESLMSRAGASVSNFARNAREQLDSALSVKRNAAGALDLGVAQMREAAAAQQLRAVAAREVAEAMQAATLAHKAYSKEEQIALADARSLANAEEAKAAAMLRSAEAAERVQMQLNKATSQTKGFIDTTGRGTTALGNNINSVRASRVAFVQLGQQMQDVVIQARMGTNAMQIFTQQVPQAAFALTGLADSADKTKARIGAVATFLSGPWGSAIFLATAVLGPFIYSLFQSGEAASGATKSVGDLVDQAKRQAAEAENAEAANSQFSRSLEGVSEAARLAKEAVESLEKGQKSQAEQTVESINRSLQNAIALRDETQALINAARASNEKFAGSLASTDPRFRSEFLVPQSRIDKLQSDLDKATRKASSLRASLTKALSFETVERASRSAEDVVNDLFDAQVERAREAAVASGKVRHELEREVAAIERARDAELDRLRATTRERNKRTREEREKAPTLPDVTGDEIARALGTTITSGKRSRADNARVGGGANSYHLIGQAIDIPLSVNGKPLTKQGIREALAPLGVEIKELLGPGDKGHDDHFHIAFGRKRLTPDKVADQASKELERQNKEADELLDSIARINEQFSEQPSLTQEAASSTAQLNLIIAEMAGMLADESLDPELAEKFRLAREEAEAAKATIEDALVRPFEQLREESERRLQIEELLTAGRETEAAVLQTIWQLESKYGKATEDVKNQVREIVEYEEAHLEVLRRQQDQIGMYLEATRSIRGELESFFAGEGASFGRIARRLQAQYSVEKLFGPAFREIDAKVKSQFDTSVDKLAGTTDRLKDGLSDLADVVTDTANRMRGGGTATIDPLADSLSRGNASLAAMLGKVRGESGVITVEGRTEKNSVGGMTPAAYFEMLGKSLTAPLIDQLEGLGIKLPASIQGALGGAVGGYLGAGPVGAVLGGGRDFFRSLVGDEPSDKNLARLGISETFGQALAGAQTGAQTDAIFKSLGIKSSGTGAAIGGALGSAFGPAGQLIGSIAGGLLGGALKSTKRGAAIIGGTGDGLGVSGFYGNSGSRKDQAGGFAGDAIEAVNRIAKQLGGQIDASLGKVSIGIREDRIVVDPQGRGYTKTSKFPDLKDFGDDAQGAIAFAVKNLIEDGVLKGLKDSEMRLIKAGDDIEAALQDVLDFRSVFQRLRAYKDPVGAALDELDTEFTRLEELFTRAGASAEEFAQLEELYGIERARALEEASERVMGSLRKLLDDINTGDMGLSLRDRRDNLLPEFNALRARVDAGDVTAFDKYDEVSRQLLELERELFGSQAGYFERLFDVRDTAGRALAEQQQLADQAANRDSPFATRNGEDAGVAPVVDSIQWLGGYLVDNLGGQLEGLADAIGSLSAPLNNFVTTRNLGSPSMPVITGQLSY